MLLSDQDIRSEIASGRIGLTPFDFKDLQPSSIDVHLGIDFFLYKDVGTIDPKRDQADLMYKTRSRDSITLAPFGFASRCVMTSPLGSRASRP